MIPWRFTIRTRMTPEAVFDTLREITAIQPTNRKYCRLQPPLDPNEKKLFVGSIDPQGGKFSLRGFAYTLRIYRSKITGSVQNEGGWTTIALWVKPPIIGFLISAVFIAWVLLLIITFIDEGTTPRLAHNVAKGVSIVAVLIWFTRRELKAIRQALSMLLRSSENCRLESKPKSRIV
jgi:hypothetical protein